MSMLITVLLVLASIVVFVFVVALFVKRTYHIERDIVINAPKEMVFDYVKHLKNQDNFNKWVMVEPEMNRKFTGIDGKVGFIYAWNGKKAGEGEQEIKAIEDGKKIETEIRFVRPFAGIAHANMVTESSSENQTKVIWSNKSTMNYPVNIMILVVEKMLAKDMDTSLLNLKRILENPTQIS